MADEGDLQLVRADMPVSSKLSLGQLSYITSDSHHFRADAFLSKLHEALHRNLNTSLSLQFR